MRMCDSIGIFLKHKFKPFVNYLCLEVTNGQWCPLLAKEVKLALKA